MTALSPRQSEVLAFLRQHAGNKQIAASMSITLRTVKFHVGSLLRVTGCRSRGELAAWKPMPTRWEMLDERQRMACILCVAGLAEAEIAHWLGLSPSVARCLLDLACTLLEVGANARGDAKRRALLAEYLYGHGLMQGWSVEQLQRGAALDRPVIQIKKQIA